MMKRQANQEGVVEDSIRVTQMNSGLKVHAVAGTYVVLLGFDLAEAAYNGLLGFSIHRTDHTEQEAFFCRP